MLHDLLLNPFKFSVTLLQACVASDAVLTISNKGRNELFECIKDKPLAAVFKKRVKKWTESVDVRYCFFCYFIFKLVWSVVY